MSKILENWFYNIKEKDITIKENNYVSIFISEFDSDVVIDLKDNSKLDLYMFFLDKSPKNIIINQLNNNSKLNLKAIFLNKDSDIISNIISNINSVNSTSNIEIISIVKENKISIDSSIIVNKNSRNINASLSLENVFNWNNWSIVSNPNLYIDTNDIKVSHSSKTTRINEKNIHYLTSRWLDKDLSIKLILDSYFKNFFKCIEMYDKNLYDDIYLKF